LALSASRVAWAYPHAYPDTAVLGASVNKNKYIFLVDLVAHFFKIVCGLYEEMERSDENSSLRN
jgi:hypothetical protein